MLRKIISKISNRKGKKAEVNFFDLSSREKKAIIEKAAKLSAQDQKNLLREYDRKYGELQTSCK